MALSPIRWPYAPTSVPLSVGMEGSPALDWAARVQRLEAEVDGLRRAMRSRAVIEQAKGFLSAALNCGLDEAFGHLARLSQHENLRVAEVAARIIGTVIPAEPEGAPEQRIDARLFDPLTYLHGAAPGEEPEDEPAQSVRLPALPAETRVRLQTAAAAVQSAGTFAELADRMLDEGTSWLEPRSATLWSPEPDGALLLVASAGVPPEVASDWQRIPSRVRAPVRDAISLDEPVWLDGTGAPEYEILPENVAAAALPLRYDGRPYAGVVILWDGSHTFSDVERRYLTGLAALAGRRYRQLARATGQPTAPGHWLQGVLDALPVATFLLAPVRDDDRRIVDFVIDYASPEAGEPYGQDAADLVGRRLLDARPELAGTGVFEAYRQVALSGAGWRQEARPEPMLIDGTTEQRTVSRSAVRLGEGLLVAWRTHDAEAQLTRLRRVEELGDIGYWEWDLVSGAAFWSPGMYQIFDRSPQRGPLSLEQLPDHVVPEDLPILENDLRTLLERRRPIETVLRLRLGSGERPVRAVLRPVVEEPRDLVGIFGVVQDLSPLHRHADAQRRSEHAAKVRRIHGAVSPRREW
jgi:PAS domain-containing protein